MDDTISDGATGDRAPVTFGDCARVAGPFFHGTRAALQVGDELVPGRASVFQAGRISRHVYFTTVLETAVWGAELASALGASGETGGDTSGEVERIYEVEPLGPFEDDPNVTDRKFPGNPTRSYRSRQALRVVGEVRDWPAHPPEVLQRMLTGLARLREQGLDVIDD